MTVPQNNDWLKRETLRALLNRDGVKNAFIFCNRKRDVASLHKSLAKQGFNAGALHGDMDQSSRTETLDKFRRNEIALLVCSDVAARGLDIDAVSHVFNFDVPFNAEDYVHRIGRTGRAGLSGTAYTLITSEDAKQVAAIEHLIKKTIDRETVEGLGEPREEEKPRRQPRPNDRSAPRSGDRRPRNTPFSNPQPAQEEKPVAAPPLPRAVSAPPAPKQPPKVQPQSKPDGDRFDDDLPAFLRRPPARLKVKE